MIVIHFLSCDSLRYFSALSFRVFSLLNENRIKYFAAADYSPESQLDDLIKKIIDRTAANEALEDFHYECIDLKDQETKAQDANFKKRQKLINQLEDSRTYATTHSVIAELEEIEETVRDQREK